VVTESRSCSMLKECMCNTSMRLGVLLYSQGANQLFDLHLEGPGCLMSAVHCQPLEFPSFPSKAGHCQPLANSGQYDAAPYNPVVPVDSWQLLIAHRPLAQVRAVGRLTHRIVRCTPDSPMNYSQQAHLFSRERPVHLSS
jgi:hypothetical protein